MELLHRPHQKKGPAEAVCHGTDEGIHLLPLHHPVGSLHIDHFLVWISHQTGQEQTTMDNQVCRKSNRGRPTFHSGLIPVQRKNGQEASLQTPHTNCFV